MRLIDEAAKEPKEYDHSNESAWWDEHPNLPGTWEHLDRDSETTMRSTLTISPGSIQYRVSGGGHSASPDEEDYEIEGRDHIRYEAFADLSKVSKQERHVFHDGETGDWSKETYYLTIENDDSICLELKSRWWESNPRWVFTKTEK